jgi:hypothetical protein
LDKPTLKDVLTNITFADMVLGGTLYTSGILTGYYSSRVKVDLQQKLLVYHTLGHMATVVALASMFFLSYQRLTGFYDNGLRWKRPEDRLRKYDNTSHFENGTVWRFINHSKN